MSRPDEPLPDPPLPLLVTGVAGVAGYHAVNYFAARFPGKVVGIRQRDNWRLSADHVVACDAEDVAQLRRLFDQWQFQSVLDCAGNCALRACELDPRLAWRTNVEGLIALGSIVVDRQVRLVHTSIDLVYSGDRVEHQGVYDDARVQPSQAVAPGYRESDPTDPVTVYGKTMVAAEQVLADCLPDACVLRISLPMGVSFNGHAGAIDWIQSRFAKGRPATLYYDEVRTPTYTTCLNRLFHRVLASGLQGLYHAGGPRRLSLYQIAQIVNRVGGYDPRLLIGCPRKQAGPVPPRAGNVALDSSRLTDALGCAPFLPWPAQSHWLPTDRDWHRSRNGLAGSPEVLAQELYLPGGKIDEA
jgi:dTDP-4-dehydrorhamnose reductase